MTRRQSCMAQAVRVTKEQRYIFDAACHRLRVDENEMTISEGRCLELIAADYLAGATDGERIQRSD